MSSAEILIPAALSAEIALPFELGQWLGRHQALAWVATRCSAADAHALRTIREQKLYRALGLTWEDFCRDHAGFSHKKADRIIEQLDEFGDSFFNLTEILKIPAPEYRALQSAVEDNTIELDGRRIPITRENTQALAEAVRTLRGRLEREQESHPVTTLQARLDRVIGEVCAALRRSEGDTRELLCLMIEDHANRLVDDARRIIRETEGQPPA
jgi:hypothetical protein